jgi:hypothetical protein
MALLRTPKSQNDPPHDRRPSAHRSALPQRASDDDVDALLVAAVVTVNGAASSEPIRDSAAALDASVWRALPGYAHRDRSLSR